MANVYVGLCIPLTKPQRERLARLLAADVRNEDDRALLAKITSSNGWPADHPKNGEIKLDA